MGAVRPTRQWEQFPLQSAATPQQKARPTAAVSISGKQPVTGQGSALPVRGLGKSSRSPPESRCLCGSPPWFLPAKRQNDTLEI
ncbi:unnamed protein product [Urochloa humidicola]